MLHETCSSIHAISGACANPEQQDVAIGLAQDTTNARLHRLNSPNSQYYHYFNTMAIITIVIIVTSICISVILLATFVLLIVCIIMMVSIVFINGFLNASSCSC